MVKEKSGLGSSASLYDIAHYIPNAVKLEVDYIHFSSLQRCITICSQPLYIINILNVT